MTILVAGQSGQVARALAERAGEGLPLTALGRPQLDITDRASIARAFANLRPSLVINASAYTAVDAAESDEAAAYRVNRDGPLNLAEACAGAGIPLIHFSTDYVFDGHKDAPYTETDATAPLGVYGQSKVAGEQAVARALEQYVILRTSWVYSPFGRNFVKTMLQLASGRDELNVVADQVGSPTSALDIAEATLAIARQLQAGGGEFGLFHLTGSGETSWHGLASQVFAISGELGGPSAKVNPIPASQYPTPAQRPANSRLEGSKIERVYGIKLPHWRDSVRACVERLIKQEDDL